MGTKLQKIQEETYNRGLFCPNCFFNNGTVCIGEFRTIEEAMNFPVKEIWCVNRTEDNKFNDYKAKGVRVLVMCDWSKNIQDSRKFIIVLLTKRGKMVYWDMNDLPIETKQFENSLNPKVLEALYSVSDEYYRSNQTKTENIKPNNQINCNKNMNRNRKNVVRLTESKLRNMIKESVRQVLRESEEKFDFETTAYDKNGNEIHEGDFVIWVDRETGRKTKYQVYEEPTEDMVKLWNKYGECEAYPEDCILIKR